MRLEIIRGTVCDGKKVKPGDVVNTTKETALILISNSKAILLDDPVDVVGLDTQSAAALVSGPGDEDAQPVEPKAAPKRRGRKAKDSSK